MMMNSPLPRGNQRIIREGSGLRSNRDSDAVTKNWKGINRNSSNLWAVHIAISALRRDFARLRRRIVGGGGTATGGGLDYKGQWSPVVTYKAKTIVRFTPDGSPAAGTFVSDQDVPIGLAPDTGAPYWSSFADGAPGMFL